MACGKAVLSYLMGKVYVASNRTHSSVTGLSSPSGGRIGLELLQAEGGNQPHSPFYHRLGGSVNNHQLTVLRENGQLFCEQPTLSVLSFSRAENKDCDICGAVKDLERKQLYIKGLCSCLCAASTFNCQKWT